MFQILDEMNMDDIENGTNLIELGNVFVSAEKVKAGCTITMGMHESAITQLMDETKIPIIVLVDKKEYFKRKVAQADA